MCEFYHKKKISSCHNNKYRCTLSNIVVLSHVRMPLKGLTLLSVYAPHLQIPQNKTFKLFTAFKNAVFLKTLMFLRQPVQKQCRHILLKTHDPIKVLLLSANAQI